MPAKNSDPQIGVKLTPSGSAPDRFIPCADKAAAVALLNDLEAGHSTFYHIVYDGGEMIVNLAQLAYAEIAEAE